MLRGFSCSGKDFVGKILSEKHNYYRFAFADSLKKYVADKYNCDISILHSQDGKKQICNSDSQMRTYRQILIDEALELRNMDPGIFARQCCDDIRLSGHKYVVITDWRYINEYDIVSQLFSDFTIIPVHIISKNQLISPIDDISEYHLEYRNNDYVLYNKMDSSIYEYIERLINYITNYKNINSITL